MFVQGPNKRKHARDSHYMILPRPSIIDILGVGTDPLQEVQRLERRRLGKICHKV
jgi:hypothetical protein